MKQRIAINCGGGYVPGLNAILAGAALAAHQVGWEVLGIQDGYDGLLVPDAYPDGGLIACDAAAADRLDLSCNQLGTAARNDPFRCRGVSEDNFVGEIDRSDELLGLIEKAGIDAIISIVGGSAITGAHALSVAFKLSRKGLRTVCIPKSVENDIGVTSLSFGYNSALASVTETLDRIKAAARDAGRVAIVEAPGHEAGWLALQSGMAARADVVLIPEISYDLDAVTTHLREARRSRRKPSLIVAAEGAKARDSGFEASDEPSSLRKSISPLSDVRYGEGARVIDRSGRLAEHLALELNRRGDVEPLPICLGQLVRAAAPTAVDRQLGLGYGAAAVRALKQGLSDVMVAFQPPDLTFIPIGQVINKVRTVPRDSEFIQIARSIGICLGDRVNGGGDGF